MEVTTKTTFNFAIKVGETTYNIAKVADSQEAAAQLVISDLQEVIAELSKPVATE